MTTATKKPSKRYPGQSIPDAVRRVVCCPECRTPLLRTETGWVCRVGLDHTKLIEDGILKEWIKRAMPPNHDDGEVVTPTSLDDYVETKLERRVRRTMRMLKRLSRKLEIPRPRELP